MSTDTRAVLDDLSSLRLLPAELKTLVVDGFVPVSFRFGEPIIRQGDDADALYVLVSGRARVVHAAENGDEISLQVLRPGDAFGEMGLLEHGRRMATVRASSDVEALRLDRSVFDALVTRHPSIREHFAIQVGHRHLQNFLREFTAFAALPGEELRRLVAELRPFAAPAGELVVRQGEPPGPMFIVEDGQLRVFVEEDGHRRPLAHLRKGDYFGEVSLFRGTPRTASVETLVPCRLLALMPATVERLLAEHPDFRARIEQRIGQYDYRRTARVPLDFSEELLPADVAAHEKVGPSQIEFTTEWSAIAPGESPAAPPPAVTTSTNGGPASGPVQAPSPPPPAAPSSGSGAATGPGPFALPDGTFATRSRRIRRFTHVRQIDEMDCGAASLAMVCRHFGKAVSLARIRQLVHTSLDGTSLRGICRAATELGLAARAVKTSARHLQAMPLPAIVHWAGNHWVVLYDVGPTHVKVADPGRGLTRIPRAEFERKWSGYAALFDYTEAFEFAPEETSRTAWLVPFFKPYLRTGLQAVGLALVMSVVQMILPIFTQVIVDRVLVEGDRALLTVLVMAMLGALAFLMVTLVVQRYLLSWVAVRMDSATLDFLTRRLLALPMRYFQTRRIGDIQRRLAGLRQVREFFVQQGVAGVTASAQLVVALGLMLAYSPRLTLVFLAVTPLYALLMYFSSRVLRPTYDSLEAAYGHYQAHQIDAIRGIETVKALGAEGTFRERMLGEFNGVATKRFRADFAMLGYDGSVQALTFLAIVLFLWVGAREVMDGRMTIGALVAFNALVALANAPLVTLLSMWDNLQISRVLLDRLHDVFEQEPEQGADRARLRPVRTLEGRVAFRDLVVQFGGPESPRVLDGLSFEIPPNTRVAIVGRSGSGKTTLVKTLAGLVEPSAGTILFDGVDLRTLNYRDLRRHIGFVLQESHLFDDTIARNIAFGEPEPDMDAVLWAARVASAHEFIERLPLGYDTRVGESGLALSGGQKQRLAIARAVYHRPPVLVFDEATSALDTESERAVKENLDALLAGRTAFVIAHRLSTVRDADLILVLERGRLVERGTHDELMQRQGLYYYLCSQQLDL